MTNKSFKELMETYENVSIHRIAGVANITYGLLLKKSKEPIANVPYDPEAINYDAVEEYLKKREVDISALPWEEMNIGNTRASLIKNHKEFIPGIKVYLRGTPTTPAEILFKTETHIVFMLEGSSEPKAWSINTFMLNGPTLEPRTTKSQKEPVAQSVAQPEVEEAKEVAQKGKNSKKKASADMIECEVL